MYIPMLQLAMNRGAADDDDVDYIYHHLFISSNLPANDARL